MIGDIGEKIFYILSIILTSNASKVQEWYAATRLVGYSLLLVIGIIVIIIFVSSILSKPIKSKVTLIFFATILIQVFLAVAFVFILSHILSIFVP
jgi:hypothetical protein